MVGGGGGGEGGGAMISGGVGGASVSGTSVVSVCQNAGVTAGGVHASVWVWVWGVVGWVQGSWMDGTAVNESGTGCTFHGSTAMGTMVGVVRTGPRVVVGGRSGGGGAGGATVVVSNRSCSEHKGLR